MLIFVFFFDKTVERELAEWENDDFRFTFFFHVRDKELGGKHE